MRVGVLETMPGVGGGNTYLRAVARALADEHDVRVHPVGHRRLPHRPGIMLMAPAVSRVHRADCWILTAWPLTVARWLPRAARRVGLFYHLTPDLDLRTRFDRYLARRMFQGLALCDRVVVIADYWRDVLAARGIQSRVIRFGLEIDEYGVTRAEVERFRREHGLLGRPVIYLGNRRPHKGALEAWNVLRGMDAHFVTSGPWALDLPVMNVNSSWRDYVLLLASSDVVLTMSTFDEGWNITAHEAMLLGVPVVGSGRGGMRELLAGGGQIVCEDFGNLEVSVQRALRERAKIGVKGKAYAEQWTFGRFKEAWLGVLNELPT